MKIQYKIFGFLDNPKIYNFIQKLLASNGTKAVALVLENLKNDFTNSFLDIGCGTGKHASIFSKYAYTGVDNNPNYLLYSSKNYSFGKFIEADVSKLPFKDRAFDCVFSVCTFHHLSDEQSKKAISEMKRVCRKGGVVCVIDNIFPSRSNLIGYILFLLDRGKFQRSFIKMKHLLSGDGEMVSEKLVGTFPYSYCVFRFSKK